MRRARFLLFLLVAAAIWLPSLSKLYRIDAATRARLVDSYSRRPIEAADRDRMRAVNPEWDFMSRTYTVLGLADLALASRTRDAERARLLAKIDLIVDDTLALEAREGETHFMLGYAKRGPFVGSRGVIDGGATSIFIDGEVLMMLSARELVSPRPERRALARERAERIERAMMRGPVLSAESYPNECWTFCNTTALAALAMFDRVDGSDHRALARAWVTNAKARLIDPHTGILVSSYTYGGETLDGPEGSSIWMSAHNLLLVDEDFARDQYARARRELGVTSLGFGWAREWPRGVPSRPDVDSGPIVPLLGASAGSSGLAVLGASAFGDNDWLDALLSSIELAAFPVERDGETRYRASNAVGDAVLFHALTFGPLWERMHT